LGNPVGRNSAAFGELMDYLDFDLTVEPAAGGGYDVAVVGSPAGEARTQMAFPYDRLALQNKIQSLQIAMLRSGGTRRAATSAEDEQSVRQLGQDLFGALFSGDVGSRLDLSRNIAKSQGKGVRIKLRFSAPELSALPWEYVYDSNRGDYLALGIATPIVRYLPIAQPIQPLEVTLPMRILAMAAGPKDLGVLDVERERLRLELALQKLIASGVVELHWVQGGTWEDLQQTLWHGPWHVFHFVGHGGFSERKGTGVLYFVGEDGNSKELSATDVARLLGDHEPLRLALLNSCETAEGASTDIFSSTAASLIRFGTPAVVAMQFQITDDAAIQFSRVFYSAVAQGMPVDSAVAEARKSVALQSQSYEWGTPVLFMRSPDGVLFDVPIQPALATPIEQAAAAGAAAATTTAPEPQPSAASPPPVSTLPPSPPATAAQPPPPAAAAQPQAPAGQPPPPPMGTYSGPPASSWPSSAPTYGSTPAWGGEVARGAPPNRRTRNWLILSVVGVVVILAAFALIGLLRPASDPGFGAFQYLILTPNQGPPGTSIDVVGSGFSANGPVDISWAEDPANTVLADSLGTFDATLTVPSGAPLGYANIFASGYTGGFASSQFLVVGEDRPQTPQPATANPRTSADDRSAVAAAALCQFQIQAANASLTMDAFNDATANQRWFEAQQLHNSLSNHIDGMKDSLALVAASDKLAAVADEIGVALDEWLASLQSFIDNPNADTQTETYARSNRVVVLAQEMNQIQEDNPELQRSCP
jgi:hypothetical protein